MASTTSGTTNFSLDVDDIIKLALDPIGGEYENAGEMVTARQVLNLILIRLRNKNIPLNKLVEIPQTVTQGVATYTLPASVNAILSVSYKTVTDNVETPLDQYGFKEFSNIPVKSQSGRPTTYMVQRGTTQETVNLWPVPNNSFDSIVILCVQDIQDVSASYQKIDLHKRYLPLLIDWLCYEMAMRRKGIPQEVRMEFKSKYEESLSDAFEEDRERADWNITIGGVSGR